MSILETLAFAPGACSQDREISKLCASTCEARLLCEKHLEGEHLRPIDQSSILFKFVFELDFALLTIHRPATDSKANDVGAS